MQNSFIFNDNIRKNITLTDDRVDTERLMNACKTANILPFIESLPLRLLHKIRCRRQWHQRRTKTAY